MSLTKRQKDAKLSKEKAEKLAKDKLLAEEQVLKLQKEQAEAELIADEAEEEERQEDFKKNPPITLNSRYEMRVTVMVEAVDFIKPEEASISITLPFDNCVIVLDEGLAERHNTTIESMFKGIKKSSRYGKDYIQVAGKGTDHKNPLVKMIAQNANRIRTRKKILHGSRPTT